jgi:hypothetical protein
LDEPVFSAISQGAFRTLSHIRYVLLRSVYYSHRIGGCGLKVASSKLMMAPAARDNQEDNANTEATMEYLTEKLCEIKTTHPTANKSEDNSNIKPTLLGIPGELRNEIWRHALVQKTPIVINRNDSSNQGRFTPALLSVSRQIRKETASTFHEENEFDLIITDLSMNVPQEHWAYTQAHPVRFKLCVEGMKHWPNLMVRLKRFHANPMHTLCPGPSHDDDEPWWKCVVDVLDIMAELLGVDWKVVKNVLELHRRSLDLKGGSWSWEME